MRVLLIILLLLFAKLTLANIGKMRSLKKEIKLTFNDREYTLSPDTERLEDDLIGDMKDYLSGLRSEPVPETDTISAFFSDILNSNWIDRYWADNQVRTRFTRNHFEFDIIFEGHLLNAHTIHYPMNALGALRNLVKFYIQHMHRYNYCIELREINPRYCTFSIQTNAVAITHGIAKIGSTTDYVKEYADTLQIAEYLIGEYFASIDINGISYEHPKKVRMMYLIYNFLEEFLLKSHVDAGPFGTGTDEKCKNKGSYLHNQAVDLILCRGDGLYGRWIP